MKSKLYYDLLEIIENQDNIISRQNKTISNLVNENLEKENMINVLNEQEKYLY
jgi:hypothetical protein